MRYLLCGLLRVRLSLQCPVVKSSETANQNAAVVVAIAIVGAIVVVGSLVALGVRRARARTRLEPLVADSDFLVGAGILRICIGITGILGSFAYVSSILTLAGGAVAVSTVLRFKQSFLSGGAAAQDFALLRDNVTLPIVAIVFCGLDMFGMLIVYLFVAVLKFTK